MSTDNQYEIKEITKEQIKQIYDIYYEKAFPLRSKVSDQWVILDEDKKKIESRYQDSWNLRVGVYCKNQPVGWHFGYSLKPEVFHMQSSFIAKDHRNKGLYSKTLDLVISKVKKEGFQIISSYHQPNNPAVLIPKLKKGFIITGSSINEFSSFMVEMKLYLDPARKKVLEKTVGIEL